MVLECRFYTIILMCSIFKMESHPRHFLLTKPYTNQELHGRYPVSVVRPHSFYCIYVQASHAGMQKFSLLQLVTVGVVSATVEELNMMDPPFTVIYHDPILPTAECHEHYAVVSQSRDLVCTGSYVQLCKPFQQVYVCIHFHTNDWQYFL